MQISVYALVRYKFPRIYMARGEISHFGVSELEFINRNSNASIHIDIIKNHLEPSLGDLFPLAVSRIFHDASASCHREKIVRNTFSVKRQQYQEYWSLFSFLFKTLNEIFESKRYSSSEVDLKYRKFEYGGELLGYS